MYFYIVFNFSVGRRAVFFTKNTISGTNSVFSKRFV